MILKNEVSEENQKFETKKYYRFCLMLQHALAERV